MPNLSDHDIKQMDEIWQSAQSESVVRSLLIRTLEDLRIARDRLNQNASNSSRPPGSMPPWQRGHHEVAQSDLLNESGDKEDDNTGGVASTRSESCANSAHADVPEATPAQASDGDAAAQTCAPTKAPNQPTLRRAGRTVGDPGHGRTQKLAPTNFVCKHPTHCVACQHQFTEEDPAQAWTAWDTLELRALSTPADSAPLRLGLHIEVTRHTLMRQHCACGHTTRAIAMRDEGQNVWEGVDIGEQRLLGPRLGAVVVYLSQRMRLPRRKVQELLYELFGLEISTALIDQTIKQTARSVEPLQAELVAQLDAAVLLHADETSWPESARLLWLWVLCCSHTVLYVIGARTKDMFDNALSAQFKGLLMSDGYGVYRHRERRLRCWAHLMRKLCGVSESTHQSAALAGKTMLDLFAELMSGVFQARDRLKALAPDVQDDPPELPVVTHAQQLIELRELCERHRDAEHQALRAIARELLNDWQAIMYVLTDPLLPLTNNAAERQLRHWVIARRVSYGTRNLTGSNSLALLASVIDTCRLRGASITDMLAKAIEAARLGLPTPKLPPIPAHLLGHAGALVGK